MKEYRSVVILISLMVVLLFNPEYSISQTYFNNKNVYVTQMHVHGWSHHNGAPKPGSLQYHNKQADSADVDVLWWSEHHPMYRQDTGFYHIQGGVLNPSNFNIEGIVSSSSTQPDKWECLVNDGTATVMILTDTLKIMISSSTTDIGFKKITYSPRSSKGLIKDFTHVKPLATEPILEFDVKPEFTIDNNGRFQIIVRLAWQLKSVERQDILVYNFIEGNTSPTYFSNNSDTVWIQYPLLNNSWQNVSLDLASASLYLQEGIDNIVSDIEFRFLSRLGDPFQSSLTNINIIPTNTSIDSLVSREKSIQNNLSGIYNTHNILGVELSHYDHLNGFFPHTTTDPNIYKGKISGNVNNWVSLVHNEGGVVSYNHMFGPNWNLDPQSVQTYRSDTTASYLLQNNAYDSDILEVGYLKRGGSDLANHLKTWDKLTASGLFMYGNGVSDSHGSLWLESDNLFHTFIWADDSTDLDLLQGLSLGKMYFGIYKNYSGKFYYTLGNLEMGDRGILTTTNNQPFIHLDPFPANCKIKLTQVLIDSTLQLTYLHNETLIDTSALPVIDISLPSFIRISVYDSQDNPMVFGQPIVILGTTVGLTEQFSEDNSSSVNIRAYPNPVNENLSIEIQVNQPSIYKVNLIDSNSKIVRSIDKKYFYRGKHGYYININDLKSGNYILYVVSKNSTVQKKIIIIK